MLSNFFVKCGTAKEIFNRALGDLASCAKITRCLGFINGPMLTNLDTIGSIRNLFAHERERLTFAHEKVRELCFALTHPKGLQDLINLGDKKAQEYGEYVAKPANRFHVVSRELLVWLVTLADDAAKKP